ncbi:unnamed protein product [Closterium sp. Naga37s-1]|nr:unnamed protein product [Closterium sp. Naga37s-1]
MGGLHWRKKGGGKDGGGSSARKQVVLTAAQLTELESYIQDMEAKCAQFQTVVAQKAAAEAAMRGELQGLAAGVEGERAARESALDALMTDFERRVSARLPPPSSARSPLATITSSATAASTEPDSISPPSTLAPPSLPSSLTSSLRSSVRPALPSSLSSSLTTFVSSSSEIEALAQRARAAALAAASAAAGRGAGAGVGAAGGANFAALPGVSAGGGDFPGMAEAGGMMTYPGGPHTSLIPTSSTGAGSAVTERSDGGGGGGWSLGLGLRWSGGRVQRRQRFVVDTAWLEGIRRVSGGGGEEVKGMHASLSTRPVPPSMELQRQLAEEQQKKRPLPTFICLIPLHRSPSLSTSLLPLSSGLHGAPAPAGRGAAEEPGGAAGESESGLAAEKAWMEAALMRFLQMKRQHEEEVAQLMAKVARLEQAVASSSPSVAAAAAERTS